MNIKTINKFLINYIMISIILSIICYFYVDVNLYTYINKKTPYLVLQIADYITEIGNAKYYYIAIIVMLFYCNFINKNNTLKEKVKFSFLTMLSTTLITYVAKFIIGRSRPKMWEQNSEYSFNPFYFDNTYDYTSLPSGHTQTSFTVAILLSIFFPKYKYVFISIAIISGLSRVVLSAHWLSDVIIGAVFGITIPLFLYRYKKINKKN